MDTPMGHSSLTGLKQSRVLYRIRVPGCPTEKASRKGIRAALQLFERMLTISEADSYPLPELDMTSDALPTRDATSRGLHLDRNCKANIDPDLQAFEAPDVSEAEGPAQPGCSNFLCIIVHVACGGRAHQCKRCLIFSPRLHVGIPFTLLETYRACSHTSSTNR